MALPGVLPMRAFDIGTFSEAADRKKNELSREDREAH